MHPSRSGAYSPVSIPFPSMSGACDIHDAPTSSPLKADNLDLEELDFHDGSMTPGNARDELLDVNCLRSSSTGAEHLPLPPGHGAPPDMLTLPYVGLYCQYAAVGLLYGSAGTLLPFCVYVFDGPANVCR